MNKLLFKMLGVLTMLGLAACASTAPATGRPVAPPDTTHAASALTAAEAASYRLPLPAPAAGAADGSKPVVAALVRSATPLPTHQVNELLAQRLNDQATANRNVKYAAGYRIQVYLGIEREQVMAIRRAVIGHYPDEHDYLSFKAPVYRLLIGDYLTRLEAERMREKVKAFTPKAEIEAMQVVLDKRGGE